MAERKKRPNGLGGAIGGSITNPSGLGDAMAKIAMEIILERLREPQPTPWSAKDDMSGATRKHSIGGVDMAYHPAGARVQPPMRGRPYTSYNRSRLGTQNAVPVGEMNNLPFQALINRYIETMSFPPMYGQPRQYPQTAIPISDEHVYLPRTM